MLLANNTKMGKWLRNTGPVADHDPYPTIFLWIFKSDYDL